MKFLISTLLHTINQTMLNFRYKKLAQDLLNLTDNQLKGLGLNRYVIIQTLTTKNWTELKVNKINGVSAAANNVIHVVAEPAANDDKILSVA
jgi:hypothetical protein